MNSRCRGEGDLPPALGGSEAKISVVNDLPVDGQSRNPTEPAGETGGLRSKTVGVAVVGVYTFTSRSSFFCRLLLFLPFMEIILFKLMRR